MLLALWSAYNWDGAAPQQQVFNGGGRLRLRKPDVEYEKQSSKDFLKQKLLTEKRQAEEDALILLLMS
jgi:hypothetical protein